LKPGRRQINHFAPAFKALVFGFLGTLNAWGDDEAVVRPYYEANIELFNVAMDIVQSFREV